RCQPRNGIAPFCPTPLVVGAALRRGFPQNDQAQAQRPHSADQAQCILARLDPTHEQDELAVAEPLAKECGTGPTERAQNAVGNNRKPFWIHAEEGGELPRLGVRVGQDPLAERQQLPPPTRKVGAEPAERPGRQATDLTCPTALQVPQCAWLEPANRREHDRCSSGLCPSCQL